MIAIIQDESLSHSDRVIARVAYYKTLYKRLVQFKEKFPDCKKYLEKEKKKNVKLKNKVAAKTKKSLKENPQPQDKNSEEQKINKNMSKHSQDKSKNEETCNIDLPEATSNFSGCKELNENSALLKKEEVSESEVDTLKDTVIHKQPNIIKPCNVTKEATVKRFTELLEEQESSESVEMSNKVPDSTTEQAKISDDFFITGDNQDYQTSSFSASTSYATSHKHNTQIKTFQSSNRAKNIKYQNDKSFHKKYQDNQSNNSVKRLNNKPFNKINKDTNKSNSNDANNKEKDTALHPSWLAKRNEQKIQAFQGKKIVFAD